MITACTQQLHSRWGLKNGAASANGGEVQKLEGHAYQGVARVALLAVDGAGVALGAVGDLRERLKGVRVA